MRKFTTKRIHFYDEDPSSERFYQLCSGYNPDAIWYISGYADGGKGFPNEANIIEGLIKAAHAGNTSEVVAISSVNSLEILHMTQPIEMAKLKHIQEKCVACAQSEKLMEYYAAKYDVNLVIIRTPYIAKRMNEENYLGSIFTAAEENKPAHSDLNMNQNVDFISIKDVIDMLVAVSEESDLNTGEYTAYSGFGHTYQELEQAMKAIVPSFEMEYQNQIKYFDSTKLENAGRTLRKNYGFVATDNVIENIEQLYNDYTRREKNKRGFWSRIRGVFDKDTSLFVKLIELFLFFFVVQFLLGHTADSVYFRYVDLRLFYVVMIALSHGMGIGIMAGLLECVSLFMDYNDMGVTGTMLFYNIDYWLPFVVYLLAGSVIGYVKNTYQQKEAFLDEEKEVLEDKYLFLSNVYQQVIDNKGEYKRQILGYQDSFGKIFEAVEDLDATVESDVFMNGVEILERILDNRSVAIYTMDEYQKYMRLAACSKEMSAKLTKSLKVDEHKDIYEEIVTNAVWKNTELVENTPMYAFGINKNKKVRVMIALYEADSNQMGLYYLNLFSILCNLIRVSFERAYEYQIAIEDDKYLENTEILKPDYFNEVLDIQNRMEEAGVASYALIKFESSDAKLIDEKLRGLIRQSDILGLREDGKIYLILTQITTDNVGIIDSRLKVEELKYEIVRE